MKRGHLRQRHTRHCPRSASGGWEPHRCRGTWEFTVDLGRAATGERRQLTKAGFATKRDAVQALQRCLDEMQGGVEVETRITTGTYFEEWLASKRSLRPSTLKSYREHIRLYLKPLLGHVPLRELRPRQIDLMLGDLARPRAKNSLSSATVRRIHSTLRVALNDAVRRRLISHNPAQYIDLPVERRQPPTVWTPEQVASFLSSVRKDRLYALYHLVVVTGLRRGELCALSWDDVQLDRRYVRVNRAAVELGGRIHVGPPKTRSGVRTVPLDGLTIEVLRAHRLRQEAERQAWGNAYREEGLVFTQENGAMLRPEGVSRRFRNATRRADLPLIRFHDLRHTSASIALAAGVAMKVVSERLGHSTIGITADLYTHVVPAVARDAAEAIAAVLRPVPSTSTSESWRDVGAEAPKDHLDKLNQEGS